MQRQFGDREDRFLPPASGLMTGRPFNGRTAYDPQAEAGQASATFVRSIIRARAARRRFFDEQLFSDPAWDILLELFALRCEGLRISVSKLSVAANVPCTTALRWLDKLESESLAVRTNDPSDGRRVWIELSDLGFAKVARFLEQISKPELAL
jgi:DNA-binding MarR family transcriptional regulator